MTNDPADKIAEIEQAIFQDMNTCAGKECTITQDKSTREDVAAPVLNLPRGQEVDDIVGMVIAKLQDNKLIPIMEDSNMKKTKKDESVDESEDIKKDEDIKKSFGKEKVIEAASEDIEEDIEVDEAKEVDGKEPIDAKPVEEKKKPKKKKAKKKTEEVPAIKETADDSEFKISGPVNEKPVIETQDSAIKITGKVVKTEIVETADNVYEEKYRSMLIKELADSYVSLGKASDTNNATNELTSKSTQELEIFQDAFSGLVITADTKPTSKSIAPKYRDVVKPSDKTSDIVPQHGGTAGGRQTYAFQDLSPKDRTEKYGDYGSFDLCFHPQNASKYINKRK